MLLQIGVKYYAIANRNELEFLENSNAYVEFEDFNIVFTQNVTIVEDTVEFDVVVDGQFSYGVRYKSDYDTCYNSHNETAKIWMIILELFILGIKNTEQNIAVQLGTIWRSSSNVNRIY